MIEIILDTETTGLSVKEGHRIVEIGCLEIENLVPTKKVFHQYINPEGKKVDESALKVHGYTDEFLKGKKKFNTYTYVFVNALTGNTSAWNGLIGKRVKDEGYGYLTYNFRGQINSSFDKSINLTSKIIISDLLKLIDHLNLKNILIHMNTSIL